MSTIKCRTCDSQMITERRESSGHATTSWYQCPLCRHVRLTSEYETDAAVQHLAANRVDDDMDTNYGSSPYL